MDTLLNPRTVRQQPTGVQTKNLASKMLAICSLLFWMSGHLVLILFMFIVGLRAWTIKDMNKIIPVYPLARRSPYGSLTRPNDCTWKEGEAFSTLRMHEIVLVSGLREPLSSHRPGLFRSVESYSCRGADSGRVEKRA